MNTKYAGKLNRAVSNVSAGLIKSDTSPDGSPCDYCLSSADGGVVRKYFNVFPGISLVYESMHVQQYSYTRPKTDSSFEICYCREGRYEGSSPSGLFYLGPGDMSVCSVESGLCSFRYPLSHYHGIRVIIDTDRAPRCLSCFLEDVKVQPAALLRKFCRGSGCFVARSLPSIAHIFDELYSVPESILRGYLKVKVLELTLFLTRIDVSTDELEQRSFTNSQKILAENITAYLSANLERKVTLDELSEAFHVSGSQIKFSLRAVYGSSLSDTSRIIRMQSAAGLLRDTDSTIMEIAGMHGYDNASKFAAAFRSVMGQSPSEYRSCPTAIENRYF